MADKHTFEFFRAGGVDQVVLRDGGDIAHLADLDPKLWVALSCPVRGLAGIEEKTLTMLDEDKDGRIRVPDVLKAVSFLKDVFGSLDILAKEGGAVSLKDIKTDTETGKAVAAGAKQLLADTGKKGATIEIADVDAARKALVETRFNGDGVIPAAAAEEAGLTKAVEEIIDAMGSVEDRSGKPGVNQSNLEGFFTEATALVTWAGDESKDGVKPLGDASGDALDAYLAVREKVVDYFTRCRIAGFDTRASEALRAPEGELQRMTTLSLSRASEDLAKLPLAGIEASRALPLESGLNPAWAERVHAFAEKVVSPALGQKRAALTEAEFTTIEGKLAARLTWFEAKPKTRVEKLGVARLGELVSSDAKTKLAELIEKDQALAAEYASFDLVEKAIRLRRDFLKLLRNFVSFADFYGKKGATFQAGTLYLDSRACELAVRVEDAGKHAALAGLSKAFLVYCDCTRKGEDKLSIVAAITAGDVDNIIVGRNGLFFDREGRDWDATITSVITNPISVREAFWTPYKRLVRLIEEQIAKRAAEKEKESTASIDAAAAAAANADAAPPAAAPGAPPAPAASAAAAPKPKVDVGTVAAIGVALGSIGTFLGVILGTFLGLGIWMPLGLVAVLLLISGPSMLIAWLKLRQRNLGPILDANGWAINGRVKVNVAFGASLTKEAKLPEGASRTLNDPFADKPTPWRRWVVLGILLALLAAWAWGKLDRWLPEAVRSSHILPPVPASGASAAPSASAAPAAPPAAPPKP
ncbi:MAG: hypothetical protein JNL21_23875 [Myxococcales bacterium]|nr:hypothetical protein [Myxococcales bacterium]